MNADAIGYDFRIPCLQFSATFSKRTNQQIINQSKIAMALNKKYALPSQLIRPSPPHGNHAYLLNWSRGVNPSRTQRINSKKSVLPTKSRLC